MKKSRVLLFNREFSKENIVHLYFLCFMFVLISISIRYLTPLSMNVTFYLFLLLIFGVVLGLNLHDKQTVIFSFGLMALGLIIYHHTTDPLQSPDAYSYYQQVFNYSSYKEYLEFFIQDIKANLFAASSYTVFSFFYIPLYQIVQVPSEYLIVFLNVSFLIAVLYLARILFFGNFNVIPIDQQNKVISYFIILTFSSASLLYFSSTFYKDMLSLLLCLLTVFLFLKKRYLLFAIILFISIALRPYAIVTSMIYFIFIRDMRKSAMFVVLISAAYVFSQSGMVGLINSVLNIRYLLFSPNPFSIENYRMLPLQTVESLVLITLFLLSIIVYLTIRSSRPVLRMGIMCIYIYSCVMTLVGFGVLDARSMDYVIGSAGDSFSRKKIGIIILVYFIYSYVLARIRNPKSKETK